MQSTAALAASSRLDALLAAIQPSPSSEFRRLTIAHFIVGVIKRCFQPHHQVEAFMFGSVPLRAVLPDGDIDISVFAVSEGNGSQSSGGSSTASAGSEPEGGGGGGGAGAGAAPPPPPAAPLRDTWASQLLRALEREASRPDAAFKIRDVQIIQAEVKLVKCVVADVVVDVSFDTVGGLCTVAFLEAADRRIGRQHLFKRSILLLKAWCYYESRLLGAHHGLISSYALEVLVLYIFNQYHAELHTPLDVLRRFLSVLGSFDWERYALALQGPLPLAELHSPRVDLSAMPGGATPLLDDAFMQEVLERYSVAQYLPQHAQHGHHSGHSGQGGPAAPAGSPGGPAGSRPLVAPHFPLKHLNIVDPLLPGNNLGRSVSKASYSRVKKALALGNRTLEEALLRDPRSAVEAIDQFFRNTWRSPMRMAADNQAFLARLCSTQLPPAATEAILAAAAAAGFPLQPPQASGPAAGASMAGGAAQAMPLALPRSSSTSSLPQQAQQAALAAQQPLAQQAAHQQAAHQQAAHQQHQQQQQQQSAYSAALLQQQQQQAAALLALQSKTQNVQQGARTAGATDEEAGGSKRSAAASAAQPPAPAGTPEPGLGRATRSAPTSPQQPARFGGSSSRQAAGQLQPPQQPQQQRQQPEGAAGGVADGWQGVRPAPAVHASAALAAAGMATAPPNTPVAAAAGRLSTPQLAVNAQLAMLRQGAGGYMPASSPTTQVRWSSGSAPTTPMLASSGAPAGAYPGAPVARPDASPHHFFGGDLEAMQHNLAVARRRQQPSKSPGRAAPSGHPSPRGQTQHQQQQTAGSPSAQQLPLPLPVSLAKRPAQVGASGPASPVASAPAPARSEAQQQAAVKGPSPGAAAAAAQGTDQAAPAGAAAAPTPAPAHDQAGHDLAEAMAVLPAVRTRSSQSDLSAAPRAAVPAPAPMAPPARSSAPQSPAVRQQQRASAPQSPAARQPLQARTSAPQSPVQPPAPPPPGAVQPPPLPIAPRGRAPSEDGRPKTFAAALRSSSRSSSSASLAASPQAQRFSAAHASSLASSPSHSVASGGGTPVASRRPAWGRGSSSNLAGLGSSAASPAAGMGPMPALPPQAQQQQRSWSAVAAGGAFSRKSSSASLAGSERRA